MIIYGIHPVLNFIKYKPSVIKKLYISNQSDFSFDITGLKAKIVVTSPKEIDIISKTNDNQGICAEIEQFPYATQIDYDNIKTLCVLDHVQDPRNVGAIIRNAVAFNVDAIIIPKDRACEITPTTIKASAGAAAVIPVIKVGNINQTIRNLKDQYFWVYGFEANGDKKLSETIFDRKTVLVLGSEGKGVSALTRKLCDFVVSVEMNGQASSLNVSSCAAVVFYHRYIQMEK